MTTAFQLSLPTDIPWERICVSKDMMDDVVCDKKLPGKWRSSIAVFKYTPQDDYQKYPKYKIAYLKVTVTITGYQPIDQEIQGTIKWSGVNVETIDGMVDLLSTYMPCHGAIVQVAVGPHGSDPDLPKDRYPFFLDAEPKKRELYEMVTDTKERQSRSLDALNVTKSAGTTQSVEVLDIDQGFNVGGSVSAFGTGAGFNYGEQGQWGTKNLNSQESMIGRSTDAAQEKRETFSHTTQLSQMYHLLDSYHIGTNRVVFFVQPRPHVLEEPSGFVKGPRPVEGIQEFFLVVAHDKTQADFCVSVRLDTSHLTDTDILDYDRKDEESDLASVNVPAPKDPNDRKPAPGYTTEACVPTPWPLPDYCFDVHYKCFTKTQKDDKPYLPPAGYLIDLGDGGGFTDLINDSTNGSTNVSVAPDGSSLVLHAEATSHICEEPSGSGCVDCPDETKAWSGTAKRQVLVHLVSEIPTKKIGTRQVLVVTTRGLCCCPPQVVLTTFDDERVTAARPVPEEHGGVVTFAHAMGRPDATSRPGTTHGHATTTAASMMAARSARNAEKPGDDACPHCAQKFEYGRTAPFKAEFSRMKSEGSMSPQQANAISDFIRRETLRSLVDPRTGTQPGTSYLDTDLFARQLASRLARVRGGRALLTTAVGDAFPREARAKLEEYFGKSFAKVTRHDVLRMRGSVLAALTGLEPSVSSRVRLRLLGVELNEDRSSGRRPGEPEPVDRPPKARRRR
jgi:hypothetical protein